MDTSIFFGGSVVVAVVAGMIALFAPCCISVMLPAYFAGSFHNRRVLIAMTFLFAAGVASVILPLALGANVLRQLFTSQHTPIYLTAGLLMSGLGLYLLLGGQIHLPMPGRRASGKTGPISIYSLGVFSGVASSCCAPVLAGVIALSGAASSFGLALGLGAAYVFGMVAPLFLIALLWERFDWRSNRLFRPRSVRLKVGPVVRTLTSTGIASGVLLAIMGVATAWIGLTGSNMGAQTGWQGDLSVRLQHYGHLVTQALAWVPGWLAITVLVAVVALLGWRALRQMEGSDEGDEETKNERDTEEWPAMEETVERQA